MEENYVYLSRQDLLEEVKKELFVQKNMFHKNPSEQNRITVALLEQELQLLNNS